MDALTVALRTVHYAAAVALFGEFAFLLCIARPALEETARATPEGTPALRSRVIRVGAWSLGILFASGAAWLAVEAASMSGATIARALDRDTLGAVLAETQFGRTWMVRFGLAVVLSAAILFFRRASGRLERAMLGVCASLSGGLLGSLAWAGHAAAERGADRIIHLSADVLHLLAAGAWLGALAPLAFVLALAKRAAGAQTLEFAARSTRRFSSLGVASVGTLILTGCVNAWYTVGSVPALFGTDYGRLLSAKIALFALMVALAAINRLRLAPRLPGAPGDSALRALERLRRNAIVETALGAAVLGIVGGLGATIPALHVQTVWPFPYTLDWEAAEDLGVNPGVILIAPLVAFTLVLAGLRTRGRALMLSGIAGLVVAIAVPVLLLAVPAYPTTYLRSPVAYTTASIARGGPLYALHCAICHGELGRGDGPAAASLPMPPADLTEHLFHHREGDLLWWLEHGISGTPMPGFAGRIDEDKLWDVLNFLRAQAEAEEGKAMSASVEPWQPIVAPDFTFQIGGGEQETLAQQRGRSAVLLVFYSPPGSLERLRALSRSRSELERLGVRVIAVPMAEADAILRGASAIDAAALSEPDPRNAAAYAVFWRRADGVAAPGHVEFLIDLQGYLRARWIPGEEPGWKSIPELLRQAQVLKQEKPRALAPVRHVH
jgi:putative copper resistance protein D